MSSRQHDAVIVGSGINSLTCAALLARRGWSVCVLERNAYLGGAVKTAEVTVPGFRHDVFSCWHSAWVSGRAYAVLESDLAGHGLEYLNTEYPAATAFPDGSAGCIFRTPEQTSAEFERFADVDGAAWRRVCENGVRDVATVFDLTRRAVTPRASLRDAYRIWRSHGRRGLFELSALSLESARDWLPRTFEAEQVRGILAPWVLHAGMGPDSAGSSLATQALTVGKQRVGSPIPKGGGSQLVHALAAVIGAHGGALEMERAVDRVLVRSGRAYGVQLSDGSVELARRAVVCAVTPTQLYGRLVAKPQPEIAAAAARFRYGLADMQVHYALSEPARWRGDDRLDKTAVVHVTSGLDGVSRAVNEAARGLLPAEPTMVVGQPLTVDPSRAPAGTGMLWVQVMELPWHARGDAGGEIDVRAGVWTEELRDAFAQRVHERLRKHVSNLDSAMLARTVLSPADLQAANVNLVHGDPCSGAASPDQSLVWRPLPDGSGHRTSVERLWHIGASTYPGPGVSGTSGLLVAEALTARGRRSRFEA